MEGRKGNSYLSDRGVYDLYNEKFWKCFIRGITFPELNIKMAMVKFLVFNPNKKSSPPPPRFYNLNSSVRVGNVEFQVLIYKA